MHPPSSAVPEPSDRTDGRPERVITSAPAGRPPHRSTQKRTNCHNAHSVGEERILWDRAS